MASITWTRGFFRIYLLCSIIFLVGSAFYSLDKISLRHVVTCSDDLVLDKRACIEELKIKERLLKEIPSQVKLIPMIKREKIPEYYSFADAIIGNMRIGTWELVEFEGVLCGKPVLSFSDPLQKLLVKDKYVQSPFLPNSNNPKEIATYIDKIVLSQEFRNKLFEDEQRFVFDSTDKEWISNWWDTLFEKYAKKYGIKKESHFILIKLRMWVFLIGNRMYWKKIKNYKI